MARDGIPLVIVGAVLTALLFFTAAYWSSWWLWGLSVVAAIATVFVIFFFRDPERQCEAHFPGLVVSPADGTIIGLDQVADHDFVGNAVRVSIFLSLLDVHVNRIPVTGVVNYVKYRPGVFVPAFKDKASEHNERTEIGMVAAGGQRVLLKQIAGVLARRVVCRLTEGDRCEAGLRFGMIRFGSRVELLVPADTALAVGRGDRVKGGRTVIGRLGHRAGKSVTPSAIGGKDVQL